MDRPGSISSSVEGFGNSGAQLLGSATSEMVVQYSSSSKYCCLSQGNYHAHSSLIYVSNIIYLRHARYKLPVPCRYMHAYFISK
jgi:hypothetical protein